MIPALTVKAVKAPLSKSQSERRPLAAAPRLPGVGSTLSPASELRSLIISAVASSVGSSRVLARRAQLTDPRTGDEIKSLAGMPSAGQVGRYRWGG